MKNITSHRTPLAEINVTPFVDVVLVLLIIFMVTAPLLSQGLDVDLPEAEAPAMQRSENDVILTMNKEGEIFFEGEKKGYTLATIEEKLQAVFEHRQKKELLLQADKEISYGKVVKAIALFKKSGIERVGMMTEEPKKKGEKG